MLIDCFSLKTDVAALAVANVICFNLLPAACVDFLANNCHISFGFSGAVVEEKTWRKHWDISNFFYHTGIRRVKMKDGRRKVYVDVLIGKYCTLQS